MEASFDLGGQCLVEVCVDFHLEKLDCWIELVVMAIRVVP